MAPTRYHSLRSTAVRPHNRRLVLQLLRAHGALTRPAIVAASGLSAAAVSNVVADLLADGLVTDADHAATDTDDATPRPVGRPPATLTLDRDSRVVLAVQIGAGIIQVGLAGLDARLQASTSFPVATGAAAAIVLDEVADALGALLVEAGRDDSEVLGIGVGAAGLVDRSGRVNVVAANTGWRDVAMADHLEARLGLPTTVDHNVRAMATGEARYGHGADVDSLLYVYARTGLGVGLVLDGRPYRGGRLGSNEIGHVAVPGGGDCGCGKVGCVETVVSDGALARQLHQAGVVDEPTFSPDAVRVFGAAVAADEPAAVAVRDRVVTALADALAGAIDLVDPHLVVLGGLLDECGDTIATPLHTAITERLTPWTREGFQTTTTAFGDTSGLVGAATLALDSYLFGLTPLRESGSDVRRLATAGSAR